MCNPCVVSIVSATAQLAAANQMAEQDRMSAMAYKAMALGIKLTPRGNCPSCGAGKYTRKAQGYVCDYCGNNR